jgi:hypothetical protein
LQPALVSTIRAATFGPGDAWILYTKTDFMYSKGKLPLPLVRALERGKNAKPEPWIINVRGIRHFETEIC